MTEPTRLRGRGGGGGGGGGKGGGGSTATEYPNTLRSKATAKIIEAISEGPIVGLVNGERSILFDDTPWKNADGTANFKGMEAKVLAGLPDQALVTGFEDVENEVAVGQQVRKDIPVVRQIVDPDLDAVRVTLRTPAMVFQDPGNGSLYQTSVEYKIEVQPAGGEYYEAVKRTLAGKTMSSYEWAHRIDLPKGRSPWNIKVTRISSDSTSSNLQNDFYWAAYTEITDHKLSYPNTAYAALKVDAKLFGGAIPRRTYEVKGLIIKVPSNYYPEDSTVTNKLLYSNSLSNSLWTKANCSVASDGAIGPTSNQWTVTMSSTSTCSVRQTAMITPAQPYLAATRWFKKGGTYTNNMRFALTDVTLLNGIRVIFNPSTMAFVSSTAIGTGWTLVRAEVSVVGDDWYRLELVAVPPQGLGMAVSWLSNFTTGVVGQTWIEGGGTICEARYSRAFIVTTSAAATGNMLGQERFYDGVWDGTFKTSWSNNPAWILYDLLTNRRYGLGQVIPEANVDKWALYNIGVYCDALVPDGFGGQEPRFTFNAQIMWRAQALQVVQMIAAAFRGIVYGAGNLVTPVADMPSDPVAVVTNANVIGGLFVYTGTPLHQRHTVALVQWSNPEDFDRPTIEAVEDAAGIRRWGWRQTEIQAFGCRSRGQARRLGKWLLDSEKNQTEMVSYRASLDHEPRRPGDVVYIADANYAGARMGGRVRSASTTAVILDAPVTLASGQSYWLAVQLPDGTIETKTVLNGGGEHTQINLSEAFSAVPANNAVWILRGTDIEARQFRIMAVREMENGEIEVSALFHDPNKYARVEENIALAAPSYSVLPAGAPSGITDLTITPTVYKFGSSTEAGLIISWGPSRDPRVMKYEVQYRDQSEVAYEPAGTTDLTSLILRDLPSSTYAVRVRAIDGLGRASAWLEKTNVLAAGLDNDPPDVGPVSVTIIDKTARLTWSRLTDILVDGYRVRYSPLVSGAEWSTAQDIATLTYETTFLTSALPGTWLVKAVSPTGRVSANPSVVINTATLDFFKTNVVETMVQEPDWSGTKEGFLTVSGNELILTAASGGAEDPIVLGEERSGTYTFDAEFDLGAVYVSRVTATIDAYGAAPGSFMSSWDTLSAVSSLSGDAASNWEIETQVSISADPNVLVWGDWQPFTIGDFTARAFRFRTIVRSFDASIEVHLTSAQVQIDMPDRIEHGNGTIFSAAGTAITFDEPFRDTPAIAITMEGGSTGDYWTITNQSNAGFTARFFNSSGTGVERVADWIAKGYGRGAA